MDIQSVLIIALVSVTIGYFAGMLVANLRPGRENPAAKENPMEGEAPAPEIARLVRPDAQAPLSIQMDGQLYSKAAQLNPVQRKSLEEALVELLRWLGYSPAPLASPAPPAVSTEGAPLSEEAPQPPEPSPLPVVKPVPAAPLTSVRPPAAQGKSIVQQIDEILQEHLAGTPLEARRIRLAETINQGVMVYIGLDQFAGIDEVPDAEIRDLIRSCVAEWEKQNR